MKEKGGGNGMEGEGEGQGGRGEKLRTKDNSKNILMDNMSSSWNIWSTLMNSQKSGSSELVWEERK